MFRFLARIALLGPCLDRRLCLRNRRQPLRTQRQFLRDRHPVRHLGLIGGLRLTQQISHFRLQLCLDLGRVLIRQRAMAAGVGVDLGAVQRHCAQLQNPHRAGHAEHLHEQPFDLPQEAAAERRDGVVVGMLVGGNKAERHRIMRRPFQSAAGKHAGRVAVDDQAKQQPGVVGRLA